MPYTDNYKEADKLLHNTGPDLIWLLRELESNYKVANSCCHDNS